MKILNTQSSWVRSDTLDPFFERLAEAGSRILLLDYDGTLAPFRVERDRAFPYPGVKEAIEKLSRSPGAKVAIVSGRSALEVRRLLGSEALLTIWGSHGWERLEPGADEPIPIPLAPETTEALGEARARARSRGLDARCEAKSASVALHWRGESESEIERLRNDASEIWGSLANETGLELIDFDGGLELRAVGRTKGSVVEDFLRETGSKIGEATQNAVIAYLGDDRTDEDAFEALGDHGLSILVRQELRPTAADVWIEPPHELIAFLDAWGRACVDLPERL